MSGITIAIVIALNRDALTSNNVLPEIEFSPFEFVQGPFGPILAALNPQIELPSIQVGGPKF